MSYQTPVSTATVNLFLDAASQPKPVGFLALKYCGKNLPLQVLQSTRGFYIGTTDEGLPCSRESVQYWSKREDAASALESGMWTQMMAP